MTAPLGGPISSSTVGGAIAGLRFDRISALSFDLKPSVGIVAKDINRLGLAISTYKEPFRRAIKMVMIPSFRRNFDSGGRPPWEPLAEDTVRLRGYSSWPILRRTGRLRSAATSFKIWDIGATSATIRRLPPNAWYGYVHQMGIGSFSVHMKAAEAELGPRVAAIDIIRRAFAMMDKARPPTKQHRVVIPKREFILFQDSDIRQIQAIFYEWVMEKAVKEGRFH